MKYLVALITLFSVGSIVYGFTLDKEQTILANKCIGFGTVGLFLLAMPLFLITYSKGKKMQDYMLTNENLKKMREKSSRAD